MIVWRSEVVCEDWCLPQREGWFHMGWVWKAVGSSKTVKVRMGAEGAVDVVELRVVGAYVLGVEMEVCCRLGSGVDFGSLVREVQNVRMYIWKEEADLSSG